MKTFMPIQIQRNLPSTVRLSMMSTLSYPRAAVAVTVQSQLLLPTSSVPANCFYYLLVQRANPPDQGKWSLPGGKIRVGEATLDAAKREINEETKLCADACKWLPYPFMTTDAIFYDNDEVAFHYLIAQCFARAPPVAGGKLPELIPSDDACDAKWYTLQEVQNIEDQVSQGVVKVIQRVEELHEKGALL